MNKKDSASTGAILGIILPLIVSGIIILVSSSRFPSFLATIEHFQKYGVLYKILSLSLMPGAGLFFIWSHIGKINQARSILMMTLFYGIFVILLYMQAE